MASSEHPARNQSETRGEGWQHLVRKLEEWKLVADGERQHRRSSPCSSPSAALFIAKIGLEIEKQEKDTKKLIIDKNLYNIDFLPIYAKKPNIRKK